MSSHEPSEVMESAAWDGLCRAEPLSSPADASVLADLEVKEIRVLPDHERPDHIDLERIQLAIAQMAVGFVPVGDHPQIEVEVVQD